jgi:UDP-N-acetylmuramoyl-L-alanyl-D-glutamate--2,6-diaminopimelate ligase
MDRRARDELLGALAASEVVGAFPAEVLDLTYDTRAVQPGALFFCVRGERVDGHDLAPEALARGAVALVVERPLAVPAPQAVVPSTRATMAPAADVFFGRPTLELPVAGVTGTNGKTTTAFLIYAMLDAAGRRPALLGTIERRIGGEVRRAALNTPEAIDLQRLFREMLEAGHAGCVIEATSEASVHGRLDCTRFASLAFTNLTQDHLDSHGTMEAYFEAKRRLFVGEAAPPAAVNVGDGWGRRLADELAARGERRLVTFGLAPDADVRPERLELTPRGSRFRAGGLALETRLRGRFNVENVLAAVASARLLELPDDAIVAGVEQVGAVPGRFELVDEGQPFAVVVDYAHTPDGLANVLREARSLAEGRVVCVFGCGGDRDPGKRPLMGAIAADGADVAIVTSDNPRGEDPLAIIADVVRGADGSFDVEPDRGAAIERAVELARDGDVVVIAGKGHEPGQQFAERTLPFDDREAARAALRRLAARA